MTFSTYGGPEVLQESELPTPELRPDEVLVAVRLAAVNPYDLKLRSGAMQENVHPRFPVTPGSELAGVVVAVGPQRAEGAVAPGATSAGGDRAGAGAAAGASPADSEAGASPANSGAGAAPASSGSGASPAKPPVVWPALAVGDEVFGWGRSGSYAEFAAARAVIRKPAGLHWETAASIVVAGATAIRVLRELHLERGETLLVHGGAGGVGSAAIQLAVRAGATVIATCSERDAEAVRELGAHPVRYGEGVFERVRELAPDGVDAVFDTAGAGVLPGSVELAGGPERVITIADQAAFGLGVTFSSGGAGEQTPDVLQTIADLVLSGDLIVAPARHFALRDAPAAQAALAAGGFRGKTLLDV
ncbi:NADP-dependent oxidoreductase [Subtercola sp. YIM 133946]|uniref:NADP-dependent oxidoreductase n=1 Tax=Subtercola sp. YIM 133946 TaxID=3118909 RepID=UPI002F92A701